MKQALLLSSIFLLLLLGLSCNYDKICTNQDPCAPTMRYFPMAVGNYWIYEVINFNTTTNTGSINNEKDTIRIIGDTIIRDHLYYNFEEDRFFSPERVKDTMYYRDSSGYVVDHFGNIKFTGIDFDKVLYRQELSPYHAIDYSIKDSFVYQLTPAGYFECLDFKGCLFSQDDKDDRFIHNYYSEDIGLVYQNIFFANPNSTADVRRFLFEYHIEN